MSDNKNMGFMSDPTDGREKCDWKSGYEVEALKEIKWERKFLSTLFAAILIVSGGLCILSKTLLFSTTEVNSYCPYIFGALGGTLGGTVFSMKWLIHSVARNFWNIDRQLWRILTPFISTAIALIITILFNSDLVPSSDDYIWPISKSFGVGFLSGYFSDNAIGKLTELAQVLFGSNTKSK